MSELLNRGNAGALTTEERVELNRLVDEFEQKTLELAHAIIEAAKLPRPGRARNGQTGR
jgi:hypothetical protein